MTRIRRNVICHPAPVTFFLFIPPARDHRVQDNRNSNLSSADPGFRRINHRMTIEAATQAKQSTGTRRITEADLAPLPAPVQRYLRYSRVIGTPWIDTVRLKYSGSFRLAAGQPWLGITAHQVYTTNPPGFRWQAWLKLFGLPLLHGNDVYRDGEGHMTGKLAGLFKILDATGEQMQQGTMIRYLQEMVWFPTAYLTPPISWTAVDDHCADVTLTHAGASVTARMFFDDDGRMLTFVARRYRDNQGSFTLDTWSTPCTEYQQMSGLCIPTYGEAVWQLADGDLPYIRIQVQEIAYNVPVEAF